MSYDYNRIAMLLHVVDVAKNYPKLGNITAAALAELEEIANPPKPKPEPALKPEPDTASKVEDEKVKAEPPKVEANKVETEEERQRRLAGRPEPIEGQGSLFNEPIERKV